MSELKLLIGGRKNFLSYWKELRMTEQRREYIDIILSKTLAEKFSKFIIGRLASRHNRVYLRPYNLSVGENKAHDKDIVELLFFLLNSQSTETLKLKAQVSKDYNKRIMPNDIYSEVALKWARKPKWTLIQAALLSTGLAPTDASIDEFVKNAHLINKNRHPVIPEISERLYNLREYDKNDELEGYSPIDFIEWFDRLDFNIPQTLSEEVRRISGSKISSHKPIKTKRESLLQMIAGMAVEAYEYNPADTRSRATKRIKSDLAKCGIELDKDTILRALRSASPYIDPERFQG